MTTNTPDVADDALVYIDNALTILAKSGDTFTSLKTRLDTLIAIQRAANAIAAGQQDGIAELEARINERFENQEGWLDRHDRAITNSAGQVAVDKLHERIQTLEDRVGPVQGGMPLNMQIVDLHHLVLDCRQKWTATRDELRAEFATQLAELAAKVGDHLDGTPCHERITTTIESFAAALRSADEKAAILRGNTAAEIECAYQRGKQAADDIGAFRSMSFFGRLHWLLTGR